MNINQNYQDRRLEFRLTLGIDIPKLVSNPNNHDSQSSSKTFVFSVIIVEPRQPVRMKLYSDEYLLSLEYSRRD